jgi:hypothetical protein
MRGVHHLLLLRLLYLVPIIYARRNIGVRQKTAAAYCERVHQHKEGGTHFQGGECGVKIHVTPPPPPPFTRKLEILVKHSRPFFDRQTTLPKL